MTIGAREYLAKTIPWPQNDNDGYVNIHWTQPSKDGGKPWWTGRAVRSVDEAMRTLEWAKKQPDTLDIYVCMSRQAKAMEKTSKTGNKYLVPVRCQGNALDLKSFYIDVDIKEGPNGYPSQEEAVKELVRFIKEVGLPKPSAVVLSGGGLHIYWTCSQPLTPDEWQPYANALVEAIRQHGLRCDAGCTVDSARVLRVPNSFNRKTDPPRPVSAAYALDFDYTVERLAKALEPYKTAVPAVTLKVTLPPPTPEYLAKFAGQECDLGTGIELATFPPIKLDDVAKQCAFVRDAIAAGGLAYAQPLWNLTTLLSTFTEGERADAHRMACKHPEYTKESTDDLYDRKLRERDQKNLGWPSCQAISTAGCGACQTCPHFGEGKSPLHFPQRVLTPAGTGAIDNIPSNDNVADPLRFTNLPPKEAVARINTEFFVLRSSGKIYRQGADGELNALPKHDFKTALGGRWVEIDDNGKRRSAADAWLDAPERREYRGLQYCPNKVGLKPNHLNLWTGWGDVTSAPGDCSIVIDHIQNNVADGDSAKSDFLLNWLADILQNPTRKPGVCVVLRGRQGCGKTVVGAIARKLLGPKNVLTVNEKDRMLGRFNSSVMNKILLVGEEMLFGGDRPTMDKLKHLITGQTLPIEFKFGDALEIESHHRLLLTSNHEQVIQAAGEERRFVIYDVSDARRGDTDYFDKLYAVADGRDNATAAAFMKFLLERDLASFQPWKEQQCFGADAALLKQKVLSLPPPLAWLQEVIDTVEGQGPPDEENYWSCGLPYCREATAWGYPRRCKWPSQFPRSQALEAFRVWANIARPFGASEYTASPKRFWKEICKVIPHAQTSRQTAGGVRTVSIDLADLQNNFEKYLRGDVV
jgi:hypothetical protein